jgi:hypothetical protein
MKSKLDTCVIVEPREHKYLLPVIDNMLNNIPNETIIQVYHGNRNKTTLLNEYKTLVNEKIWLFDLELDNLTFKQYNTLLTSTTFYENVKGENMLVFQTDSCINSNNKHGYKEYLEYDYVGAPWKNNCDWVFVNNNPGKVGNGGFSLRKKSSCLKALQHVKYSSGNEDMYFANIPFFNYPSNPKSFSVELCYHPNPFGVHAAWKHWSSWNPEERLSLYSNFTELKTIFDIDLPS